MASVHEPLVWYRKHAGARISTVTSSKLGSHVRVMRPYVKQARTVTSAVFGDALLVARGTYVEQQTK